MEFSNTDLIIESKKLSNIIIKFTKIAKETSLTFEEAINAFKKFNELYFSGMKYWDKRKIRRYKRRARVSKIKTKIWREKNA